LKLVSVLFYEKKATGAGGRKLKPDETNQGMDGWMRAEKKMCEVTDGHCDPKNGLQD
jgi:hypothetical protein